MKVGLAGVVVGQWLSKPGRGPFPVEVDSPGIKRFKLTSFLFPGKRLWQVMEGLGGGGEGPLGLGGGGEGPLGVVVRPQGQLWCWAPGRGCRSPPLPCVGPNLPDPVPHVLDFSGG